VSAQKVSFLSLQTFPAAIRSIKISADMYDVSTFRSNLDTPAALPMILMAASKLPVVEMNELEKASVSCCYLHRIAVQHGGVE
jgi:hypothetical protein